MEVRSYYATSVEAAMDLARKELGSEAMLIQSKLAGADTAHLGRYEVVFAGELRNPVAPAKPIQASVPGQESPAPKLNLPFPVTRLSPHAVPIVRSSALGSGAPAPHGVGPLDLVPGKVDFAKTLQSAGLELNAAREFFDGAPKPALPPTGSEGVTLVRSPAEQLSREIACSPGLGRSGSSSAVAALIGPSGSGKTSTIMKLAIQQGLLMGRAVRLFSFDPERIGSTSQLRDFAALAGISMADAESLEHLSRALTVPSRGLTLIDTAGIGRADDARISGFARFLRSHPEVEPQLVLRADRKASDNLASLRRIAALTPARLILTALDETAELNDLPALIAEADIPVSFLGVGQRIPEDLETARSGRLASLILSGGPESARTAAA